MTRAEFEIEAARQAHAAAILTGPPALTQLAHDYLRDLTNMWAAVETLPMTKVSLIAGHLATVPVVLAELETLRLNVPGRGERIALFRLNPTNETLRKIWIR